MKNIIIIFSLVFASCCAIKVKAQPPVVTSDTLQWLKTNIEQRSSYFVGKPLSVLLDSLYNLRAGIKDYLRSDISDDAPANTLPGDTVYTDRIKIYFGEFFGGGEKAQMHEANLNVNTHIPFIYLIFTSKIPFPTQIGNDMHIGTLFAPVTTICNPYIVASVAVGEY